MSFVITKTLHAQISKNATKNVIKVAITAPIACVITLQQFPYSVLILSEILKLSIV